MLLCVPECDRIKNSIIIRMVESPTIIRLVESPTGTKKGTLSMHKNL